MLLRVALASLAFALARLALLTCFCADAMLLPFCWIGSRTGRPRRTDNWEAFSLACVGATQSRLTFEKAKEEEALPASTDSFAQEQMHHSRQNYLFAYRISERLPALCQQEHIFAKGLST